MLGLRDSQTQLEASIFFLRVRTKSPPILPAALEFFSYGQTKSQSLTLPSQQETYKR